MSIELTKQQQQALDAETEAPPRVVDPRSNTAYYLIATSQYESIRELLEEEQRQKTIRAVGLRNAARRMGSDRIRD